MAPWPEAPEFKVTTLSYVMSLMPDTIQNDLELARHGYRSVPVGPYFVPFPDGRCIVQADDDAQSNYDEFAKFSKRDADAIEQWDAWIGGLAAVLGPLLMTTPPRVGSMSIGDLQEQLKLVWRFRGLKVRGIADVTRLMTMSIMDILDRFFETDQVKTVMALNGLIGTWAGPHEPGTGYVMAHHSIGEVGDGHLGAWATPIGGMGAVSDALASSARSFGAEIRCEAPVERILTVGGRVARRRPARRHRAHRAGRRGRDASADHVPAPARRRRSPGRLRRRHPQLALAQRHGEDQPRARSSAGVHG